MVELRLPLTGIADPGVLEFALLSPIVRYLFSH